MGCGHSLTARSAVRSWSAATSPMSSVTGRPSPREYPTAELMTPSIPDAPRLDATSSSGLLAAVLKNMSASRMGMEEDRKSAAPGPASELTRNATYGSSSCTRRSIERRIASCTAPDIAPSGSKSLARHRLQATMLLAARAKVAGETARTCVAAAAGSLRPGASVTTMREARSRWTTLESKEERRLLTRWSPNCRITSGRSVDPSRPESKSWSKASTLTKP
mmetsp:Transcript_6402/g.14909  ORF Transcript_6402/g.14909 Transcript_6402/m.14909 type:complete len:221 (-) Transcript_6402:849-1511(-)